MAPKTHFHFFFVWDDRGGQSTPSNINVSADENLID